MKNTILIILVIISFAAASGKNNDDIKQQLNIKFTGDAQIETGSFYAGLEFHHSSPLPQRISFYYPAANSIDLSTDYWTRDSTFVLALGLETDGVKEWIGHENFTYVLTPWGVSFSKKENDESINISYDFCKDKPAFILTIEIKNLLPRERQFRLLTDLNMTLRTSHTYKNTSKAECGVNIVNNSVIINYNDSETQNVNLFAANAAEAASYLSPYDINQNTEGNKWWNENAWKFNNTEQGRIPAAKFLYEKRLKQNQSLKIVQIIGSAKQYEANSIVEYLLKNYKTEVSNFEKFVINYAGSDRITTGDKILDRSFLWAKAVLAVNQHYIDGSIQPMPCPAEYNFYFTHDVLLTDLAAVNFDAARVKRDLSFIISHADTSNIIPHAYYWKDSAYITEYATPDNWNHFWFIIASGKYFRKTNDKTFIKTLLPFVEKSINETMKNKKDGLMYAYRPDWWDIGRNYGPRAFMTILATQSLKEYINMLDKLSSGRTGTDSLKQIQEELQSGLTARLWSNEQNYLVNYFEDGTVDRHYYIGSLLAAHFGMLDKDKTARLVEAAKQNLLDPKIGIYTAYPMDFHKLTDYLKLVGNEAGDPHKYINGGIWQHGNAWYALALLKAGRKKEAIQFIKTNMTIDGVINSPNGIPAFYEYRNSNKDNPAEYGQIDKPQFMWAAGWYLYCIYEIYGK